MINFSSVPALHLPVVKFNATTNEIYWTLNTTSYQDGHVYTLYSQITGYSIEIHGGNCFTGECIRGNITSSDKHHSIDLQELLDVDLVIENGANYSVWIRALNHFNNVASNFSDRQSFTTPIKGMLLENKTLAASVIFHLPYST